MKFLTSAAIWAGLSLSVGAFAPSLNVAKTQARTSLASAVSKEEDLMLTLKVILDHADRSSTVSEEQYIQQVEESKVEAAPESIDVSIPYDATVQLAYDNSDKSMSFADFKPQYLAQAIADVIAKQPKKETPKEEIEAPPSSDVSIPYDATVQLAYDKSDKSVSFEEFKPKYLAQAVAEVVAKRS
mmetsp:Transcript_10215/g.20162  ORF Transcript_10215/g.20162 Transcript_10215/m.20162 type:complete len:185 (+) Transcript_10215:168-722(+)